MRVSIISLIAITSLACMAPGSANAQNKVKPGAKGSSTVGASKVLPSQKSRSDVKKLLNQHIKRTQVKLQQLDRRLADFNATLKISPSLARDPVARRQIQTTVNEYRAAKRDLTVLTRTRYADYAAQRGINMVPDAPRTPPPPLPPAQLQVPKAKENLLQPKSKRPRGGPTR